MRSSLLLAMCVSVVGFACSSPDAGSGTLRHDTSTPPTSDTATVPPPPPAPPLGTTVGDETWADGKQIAGNTTVGAGKTVTIAPGATITVSSGVSITVQGTLKATTNATHAKL